LRTVGFWFIFVVNRFGIHIIYELLIGLIRFLFVPVKVDSSFIFGVEVMIIIRMLISVYTVFRHSIFNNLLYLVKLKDVCFGPIIV
jgi:hypothetical protein